MLKKEMSERDVERRLATGVRNLGGVAYKFVSPGMDGVPDRLIVLPGGVVWFVELKTESGRLSGLQIRQLNRLSALGCRTAVLYGSADVDRFLQEVKGAIQAS